MPNVEIKPFGILRFIPQEITSITVGKGELLVHSRRGGVTEVDLADAIISSSGGWFGLKKMVLTTAVGSFGLHSLTSDGIAAIQKAIDQANERKSLLGTLLAQSPAVISALTSWEKLCARDAYLTARDVSLWERGHEKPIAPSADNDDVISKLPEAEAKALRRLLAIISNPRKAVDQRNELYTRKLLVDYKGFLDKVESKPLTDQQRLAVVHDEDNALVVAGAGTGKTSTIVAKVGFLLEKGWAKPEEILLLAFTNKAADEMRERLRKRLGRDVEVRTFHALGLDIIARVTGKKPSICKEAEDDVQRNKTLNNIVEVLMGDETFRTNLLSFQSKLRKPYKPAWDFRTEADYTQYRLDVELRTFAGGCVRSYEECEIANWLFINGIKFEYERPYELDTNTSEYRQYKPDFYLPDYGIYIEHWGVDRGNQTAPFIDQARYREKMDWARKLHKSNKTKLVETYSYQRVENTLLGDLETKLREHGVVFAPISRETALALLNDAGILNPFCKLLGSVLTHFKSSGSDENAVQAKIGQGGDSTRDGLFLKLFGRISGEYERVIHAHGEIDFEDMIVDAAKHVREGRYKSAYRYILVDEFQDIAVGRANLIRALRDQVVGAKIFGVGDDWQSIYRFAGGNISLTTDFDKHFGFTKRTTLGHTFRFHDKIAGFSSRFVQKNPGQLRKELSTETTSNVPGVVVHPSNEASEPLDTILSEIEADGEASVMLLTRYGFNKLERPTLTALKYRYSKLNISELTAHACKGMEADYVIVRDLSRGKYGFPAEIEDDPVLLMVLPDVEKFPFAEERRLFYVALTRARKRVYLLAPAANPSPFIREILQDTEYEKVVVEGPVSDSTVCPSCLRGEIKQRNGPFGHFYSCSNYPVCEFKPAMCNRCKWGWMRVVGEKDSLCGSCGFRLQRCPSCKTGVLVERSGRHGKFWGCTNYRAEEAGSCKYTKDIR